MNILVKKVLSLSSLATSQLLLLVIIALFPLRNNYAGDGKEANISVSKGPSVIAQYLYDERDFNSLAVYVSTSRLPLGISIWGFTEVNGSQQMPHDRYNLTRSLSEYRFSFNNLSRILNIRGFAAQVEYNDITPGGGEILRFGIAYRHKLAIPSLSNIGGIEGWLQWRAHPIETDGDGGQASLIYYIPLHKKAHINGWIDLNYADGNSPRWVVGPFLNLFLHENIWVVLRYRYNGIEDALGLDGTGWALGLRADF